MSDEDERSSDFSEDDVDDDEGMFKFFLYNLLTVNAFSNYGRGRRSRRKRGRG